MSKSQAEPVARIWRGRTKPGKANEYSDYLFQHGVKKLEALGARAVQMFREDKGDESEFMVISYWDTLQAMTRWAGDDPTRIRHLELDSEFLVELPAGVQILKVLSNNWFLADSMRSRA